MYMLSIVRQNGAALYNITRDGWTILLPRTIQSRYRQLAKKSSHFMVYCPTRKHPVVFLSAVCPATLTVLRHCLDIMLWIIVREKNHHFMGYIIRDII